jgi:hypothetical protein
MARKTMQALLAQADVTLPDNITQDISAADVRNLIKDFIDSMTPGFGAVGNELHTLVALGIPPQVVPYDTLLAVTVDFNSANIALGEVQRLALGLPSTNTRVTFYAGVAAPAGNEIVFTLFRDGVNVPGGCTVSGQGIGNIVDGSFEIINGEPLGGNPIYKVMASKVSGAAADVELSQVRLILEVVPTIGA